MKNILAPSILAADYSRLSEMLEMAESGGAEAFHFDIMDGVYVTPISFGPDIIASLRDKSKAFFDVHMMVNNPERYVDELYQKGADRITIHPESTVHLDRTVNFIKSKGIEAGIALNPATPVSQIELLLPSVDMVLVMGVNPGYGGQKFISYTAKKLISLKKLRDMEGLDFRIGIDGGVNMDNVRDIINMGADFIVSGGCIFRPFDRVKENTEKFLSLI